jgi:hypothetical protein
MGSSIGSINRGPFTEPRMNNNNEIDMGIGPWIPNA